MSAAIRLDVAREKVAEMTDAVLQSYSDGDLLWRLSCHVHVPLYKLEILVMRERLKRGLLNLSDLKNPEIRRAMIDKDNLDLHAIAAGPIMQAGEIYLPAGKLSMEETRQRELSCVLSASGTEAQRATTVQQGVVHDGPVGDSRDAQTKFASPLSGDGE